MQRRTLFLLTAVEALLVLIAVYFEPTCCVRGKLHGEAFYAGKSTSWWRQELSLWDVRQRTMRRSSLEWCASEPRMTYEIYSRDSTWFEQQRERWFPEVDADEAAIQRALARLGGPPILRDPKGIPVLEALCDDPSEKVRRMARHGLGRDAEIPSDNE